MNEDINSYKKEVYAGFLVDDKELLECTSGGMATAFSKYMIQHGGYVIGVSYSDDFYSAQYEIAHSMEKIDKFKGSKYIDVNKGNVYEDTKNLLDNGEKVLFFGLPCIVAAMNKYLGKEYPNFITCELICHGPTYAEVHLQYVKYLEKKFHSKIIGFSVRKKKKTWMPTYLHAKFENGQFYEKEFYETEYGLAFSIMGKKSCYHCKFKDNNRMGDIMIGDFWGTRKEDIFWNEKGVSAIFVQTDKGEKFLQQIKGIKLFKTTFDRAIMKNQMVIKSRKVHPQKERFEQLFEKRGLIYAAHHIDPFRCVMKKYAMRALPLPMIKMLRRIKKMINNG